MSFDWIAPYYDWLTRLVFGRSIRRAQRHFLGQIPPGARVLVVGGGTGWLLVDLLKRPAVTHVTYLEASAVMLRLAQQKVQCLPTPPKCYRPLGTWQRASTAARRPLRRTDHQLRAGYVHRRSTRSTHAAAARSPAPYGLLVVYRFRTLEAKAAPPVATGDDGGDVRLLSGYGGYRSASPAPLSPALHYPRTSPGEREKVLRRLYRESSVSTDVANSTD